MAQHNVPEHAAEHEAVRKHHLRLTMLRQGLMAGIPVIAVFAILDISAGNVMLGLIEGITAAIMLLLNILTVKQPAWVGAIANLVVLCTVIVFFTVLLNGGLAGIGFIWSVGFPFIACFLVGSRTAAMWIPAYGCIMALGMFFDGSSYGGMHYSPEESLYAFVAYALFGSLAYFMTLASERGEGLLSKAEHHTRLKARELKESEARSRTLLNTIPGGVGVHRDGKWIYMNPAGLQILHAASHESIIGSPVLDCFHADDRDKALNRIRDVQASGGVIPMTEMTMIGKDGEHFPAEVQGAYIEMDGLPAMMTVFRDTIQRKRAEQERAKMQQQMEHAQRLESLGILAGGIAHDFNNMLAGIMGNAELARMDMAETEPPYQYLQTIENSCMRASELCKQMLAYAGKGRYHVEALNINAIVEDMESLIHSSAGHHIEFSLELDSDLPAVLADMAQMQQLILNFIVNAAQAIGELPGKISIQTRYVQMSRKELDGLHNGGKLPEGGYVSIQVNDTGCGMDAATQANIFDPFFTSKESGSGLGLSAVLGIVSGHQGTIRVESQLGKGSTFEVLLPATGKKSDVPTLQITDAATGEMQGGGTVLIVDDDVDVLGATARIVQQFDFDTLVAVDGLEGIDIFRSQQEKIVAVIIDMTMPRMGGIDAMKQIREINPHVAIIIASGYSDVSFDLMAEHEKPDAFMQKPFQSHILRNTLFQLLKPA